MFDFDRRFLTVLRASASADIDVPRDVHVLTRGVFMKMQRSWTGVGLIAVLLAVTVPAATSADAAGTRETPSAAAIAPAPHQPGAAQSAPGQLLGVDAVTRNDVWAVGSSGPNSLASHWDGHQWTAAPTPSPGAYTNVLSDVTVISTRDVWAVGYWSNNSTFNHFHPLVEHWDGSRWQQVKAPRYQGFSTRLFSVSAVSSDDVWAVGTYDNFNYFGLAEHWDGKKWTAMPTLPDVVALTFSVSTLGPDDVWAAQGQQIVHWDGSTWQRAANTNYVQGIAALADDDVWAVGTDDRKTLALHWDGSSWTRVQTPNGSGTRHGLYDISAAGPDDIWAVGNRSYKGSFRNLILHWDGTSWSIVPGPDRTGDNELLGVTTTSSDDAWAVGTVSHYLATAEHWDGIRWRRHPVH